MSESSKLYVGMDVHKESIDLALAEVGAGEVRHYGRIGGDLASLARVVRKLVACGKKLILVYEAGPCGFAIYRWLQAQGHECWVVSPSLTPKRPSERIKTDRRDAVKLTRLARAGELSAIHVPDQRDEAVRDLVHAREDAVCMQRQARQRLQALLLRNDIRYAAKTAWTPAHRRWIARVKLPLPEQQIAFEGYVQAVEEASARLEWLTRAIEAAVAEWRWRPVVEALQALRGVQLIHGARIVAELGDLARFEYPRQLMGFLGLVPAEDSSGPAPPARRHHQGRQQLGAARARRSRLGLSAPGANNANHRPATERATQKRARYRLEGATASMRSLSQTRRTRAEPQ